MSNSTQQLPRILLIDDDAISREVLSMMLEMHGFSVDSAEDGAHALDHIDKAAEQPGVILMDTQMPGISGVELVTALRQKLDSRANGNRADIRIVTISGSDVSEDLRLATDGFLLKPIEVESLITLLADDAAKTNAPVADAHPSATDDAQEIIDQSVLAKLKAMMPSAALNEVYTAVATDLETRLITLESAMDAGNAAEIKRIAHTIKGGCGIVGLIGAREPAALLESSNRPETGRKELLQLHFTLNKLKEILSNGLL
ncbi:MAG TPA: response regulator [Acidobacteriaceae bacterium]|jgi:CheY-like chemotaxis protein|nr:response regulator [Acidobacteriaceae bacterium]